MSEREVDTRLDVYSNVELELIAIVKRENAARAQLVKLEERAEAQRARLAKLQQRRILVERDCPSLRTDYGVDVEGVAQLIVVEREAGDRRWIS